LVLIELIESRGATVDYHDPFIPIIPVTREHAALSGRRSVPLTPEELTRYDAVVIVTDHDDVDYSFIAKHARLVLDTRNACQRAGLFTSNIVKA
jgi:UDP-N-acetyl-D-glucosamine dehydrogenase